MNSQKLHYLTTLGVQAWRLRCPATSAAVISQNEEISQSTDCSICGLSMTMPSTSIQQAELVIISENSKEKNDRDDQLLNAMLRSIGIQNDQAYVIHVPKCSSIQQQEITSDHTCMSHIKKKISLIKPKLLLALGMNDLFKTTLNHQRGKLNSYDNMPLITTYHPAHLLQNPGDKRYAFSDLQLVSQTLKSL